jgi:pimeloyl-ACP methyl ester carboxylesterase
MLHIWYPASPDSQGATLPYVERLEAAEGLLADDELSLLKTVQTHSFAASAAAPTRRGFPLLLFSHGDQMDAFLYSSLDEELASHGFVVVAVDHPGAALFSPYPDGTVVPYSQAGQNLRARVVDRATDLRFVRDQVGKLDVGGRPLKDLVSGQVGVFGHSSGGIAAALMCQEAPVIDACVNLDGRLDGAPVMTGEGISPPAKPFMYVTKPFRALTDAELRAEGITRDQATREQADTWARDGRLLAGGAPPSYRVTLNQATHETFSDEPLLREPGDEGNLKLMSIVRGLLVDFFDAVLNGPRRRLAAPGGDNDVVVELLAPKPVP